jgi:hypothetical protein
MTGSSIPNVVIVVVVITRDCGEDPASPATSATSATSATKPAEARTRHEHAQDTSGQSLDTHPPGTPGDDAK